MKHYEEDINLFIDGELPKGNRRELFNHLAICDECSNIYSDYQFISNKCKEKISSNLESFKQRPDSRNTFYKYAFYFSAAASIIILMLFLFGKRETNLANLETNKVDTIFIRNSEHLKNVNGQKSYENSFNSDKEYLEYINNLRTFSFNNFNEEKI